jgi:hypothetical protein
MSESVRDKTLATAVALRDNGTIGTPDLVADGEPER